jgi:uncharacterized transporter YbjL
VKLNARMNNNNSIEDKVGRTWKILAEEVSRLKIPKGTSYLSRQELEEEIKAKILKEVEQDVGMILDRIEDIRLETVKNENITLKKLQEICLQENHDKMLSKVSRNLVKKSTILQHSERMKRTINDQHRRLKLSLENLAGRQIVRTVKPFQVTYVTRIN